MYSLSPADLGPLAHRLRIEVGASVREVGRALGVSHVSVVKAESGSSALSAVAVRAVHHLLGQITGAQPDHPSSESSLVEEPGAHFEGPAADYLVRLLAVERGWRRALVRGVFEEHGFEVETEGARAAVHFIDDSGTRRTIQFDLDTGIVDVYGQRFRAVETSPFERADRGTWGEALELLAAVHAPRGAGWVRRTGDEETTLMQWAIAEGDEPFEDDPYSR
jgi:transcriptional regulator with XRE-family HTH domain